ncbi:alpha/beta hydrolase family protein [Rhodococcus rhodochrous]|uniref:Alpha/beta hydrolase n=1 Tax=Rhodococcus rhodochrous TaxID=1829 RepID=A0AAW4XME9_RHORH|nr:alpha/beta hydrolase [Rhodococcus rhodochrous]MCD2114863.1 alpha/beta hydrolase [Rhodococcus rhodochrous]TWH44225.1 Dienelactone hydrolase and related enzymes [Rhodococcus rhodochrous J38]
MKIDFKDDHVGGFNYELFRTISSPVAEMGEILDLAHRIQDGSTESWLAEFSHGAERVHDRAVAYAESGFTTSAARAFMRASNLYRASIFYALSSDPRREEYWRVSRDCFRRAMELHSAPVRTVTIPFEDASLPGYFFSAGAGPRPTLLAIGGFDSTAEEVSAWIGMEAQSRGWNCLVFEGPGQWGALYDNPGLLMTHDYERPVSAAVDFALTLPEVDPDRIALAGYSLGGYFAPRAFAFERRIAACVANSLLPSIFEPWTALWPASLAEATGGDFDAAFARVAGVHPGAAWTFDHGQWALGMERPSDFLRVWDNYTLDGLADRFDRPLLSVFGESELVRFGEGAHTASWAGRMLELLADVPGYTEAYVFADEEGGSTHCQMGGLGQGAAVTMSWLDNVLGDHATRSEDHVASAAKVLHPELPRVMRNAFGSGVEEGLRKLAAQPSARPLAI